METTLTKPLALVDNRTGHLMLLVDAHTLESELESAIPCELLNEDNRHYIRLKTTPKDSMIGPFSKNEAEKIRLCHRLTIAVFADGIVVRAREVNFLREDDNNQEAV